MIARSSTDLPVPADPVKKIDSPANALLSTAVCSGERMGSGSAGTGAAAAAVADAATIEATGGAGGVDSAVGLTPRGPIAG